MLTTAEFTSSLIESGKLKVCPLCKKYFMPLNPSRLICYSRTCENQYEIAEDEIRHETKPPMVIEPAIESPTQKRLQGKPHLERVGYVYLMHSENGLYKIGRALNITYRLDALNREIPVKVEIIHYFPCKDYKAMEKTLHSRFANKRVKFEWFNLDDSDVQWIMNLDGEEFNG